jgi:hypothetical protein
LPSGSGLFNVEEIGPVRKFVSSKNSRFARVVLSYKADHVIEIYLDALGSDAAYVLD